MNYMETLKKRDLIFRKPTLNDVDELFRLKNNEKAAYLLGGIFSDYTYEDIRKRLPKAGSIVSMGDFKGEVVSNSTVKESVKVKYRRGDEELVEEFKIDDIELIEGGYEDSVDESDIKLEIESPEDKNLINDLIKEN